MKNFVQYHKEEKMRYPALDVDNLSIYTSKSIPVADGDRVWLIAGEGSPRRYFLRAIFSISEVCSSENPDFRYRVKGRNGQLFDPMPLLTAEPWFPNLMKNLGNFAFGFSEVRDANVVDGLNVILKVRNGA